ncbi:MAG: FeoB-associated Cys-rich membrane protein [Phycisphaerae bacterium]
METAIVIGIVTVAAAAVGYTLYRGATGKSGCDGCRGCGPSRDGGHCPTENMFKEQ